MKISYSIYSYIAFLFIFSLILFVVPNISLAAAAEPSCIMLVSTEAGIYAKTKSEVLRVNDNPVQIFWLSSKALTAENRNGDAVAIFGQSSKRPQSEATYTYKFSNQGESTECSVTIHPVSGSFDDDSLTSESNRPTISGELGELEELKLKIYKIGTDDLVYESEVIKVRDESWRHRISESLKDGQYDIKIEANEDWELNEIAKGILIIGDDVENILPGTVVVQPIPLLSGGAARAGQTVNIIYLQMLNVSNDAVTINNISVKQNGTADLDAIYSLEATDDTNRARGSVGGANGTPFKSGVATIPITLTLAPKETRLFTLKTTVRSNLTDDIGKTLRLEVSNVGSRSNVKGDFPLSGVTWLLGS